MKLSSPTLLLSLLEGSEVRRVNRNFLRKCSRWSLLALSLLWLCLLAACSTRVYSQPTGGSRADGTIEMTYTYDAFEVPVVNSENMHRMAARRCENWNYDGAERFGGQKRICIDRDTICYTWQVTITYQCYNHRPVNSAGHSTPNHQ